MQLQRNEIMTGLLVIGTVDVLAFVLVLLGDPGLFRALVTYKIYFDNAAGIKVGAPVMLAGRKIGQVQKLFSPVSREEDERAQKADAELHPPEPGATPSPTPTEAKPNQPKYEVRIEVQVDKRAAVYRDAHARLMQLGLLGDMAIDITQGTQNSGDTSERLKATMNDLYPAARNIKDFSETVKTQPWRLIWPTTKKYPEEQQQTASAARQTINVRKSTKAKPSATPTRRAASRE